jgi:hypothetical protein
MISRKPPAKYQEADDDFVSPGFGGGNEASFDLTLGKTTKHISSLR